MAKNADGELFLLILYDGLHVKVEFEGSLKIENKKLISSKLTKLLCSSTLTMSSVKILMQNYNFLMNYSKNQCKS